MRTSLRCLFATSLLVALPLAGHATVADDLCGPLDDPCVVTEKETIDPGSTLDFGARAFQLADGASLTWADDLTVLAGACTLAPKAKLVESRSLSSGAGFLRLTCGTTDIAGKIISVGGGVLIEGDGPHTVSGKVLATGDQVGVIAIDSYGLPGHITVTGKMQARSKVGTPPGEFRLETNFGNIAIGEKAKIKMKGAVADPFTEYFIVIAHSGSLTVEGQLDAGAKVGGYGWNLEADQNVSFGLKSKIKAKAAETGSEIAINSQSATVDMRGKVLAAVKNASQEARVHVCASDDVLMGGKAGIDVRGDVGGSIIVGAGDRASVGELPIFGTLKLLATVDGDIEVCGGTLGIIWSNGTKVDPEPVAEGLTGECLSPSSQVIFFLDCNQ